MNSPTKFDFEMRTFPGPSVFVPFTAVVAEFAIPTTPAASMGLPETLRDLLPESVVARIQALNWRAPFETSVAAVAQALRDWDGSNDLPCGATRTPSGRGLVFLGYSFEQTAALALRLGYELALVAYAQGPETADANSTLTAGLAQLRPMIERQQSDDDRALMRAARVRGIPFFPVAPGHRILQYGQGKYGQHFFATGSQRDSQTGAQLQHNKVFSNLLVRRLGFPGVEHGVAETADNAVRLATQIGYPVVIKPIDSTQGRGVTAGVISEEEVAVAFAVANAVSPGRVIVERFVDGGSFRLTVYGGRLAYVNLRSPPQVRGTGEHTVAELIGVENQRRSEAQADSGTPKKLTVDADMLATLKKQKLGLNDRVPAGQVVTLHTVTNVSGGGSSVIVTDRLHPDNREMAEAIVRCFRLNTAGIDFITPDIAKSWRAVPCAVIEINSAPNLPFPDWLARLLLERAFPGTFTARIPSVVVVSLEPLRAPAVLPILQRHKVTVGFAERASASLGGQPRFIQQVRLADHVAALLLDPACEALVVACMQDDILREGLPLDHCDVCIIDPRVKLLESVRTLLTQCSSRVITDAPVESTLAQWLAEVAIRGV
jgi:cyanophycin synthetase